MVQKLLEHTATVDAKDATGKTALDVAVRQERSEVAQLLLKHKVKAEAEIPIELANLP